MNKISTLALIILLSLCAARADAQAGTASPAPSPCFHYAEKAAPGGGTAQDGCEGSCGGHCDMVCLCGNGKVSEGEQVKDMVIILSKGTVKGRVTGSCVLLGGALHLGRAACIEGDMVALFSTIEKEKGAEIRGSYVNIGSLETSAIPGFIKGILSGWDIFAALIALLAFSRLIARSNDRFLSSPAQSLVAGFLGIIAFIPVLLLLTLSIVGIALIPLVPLFYLTGFILGFTVLATSAGERLLSKSSTLSPMVKHIAGLIIIALSLQGLALLPGIGPILSEVIRMTIRTAGLGLLIMMTMEALRKSRCAPPR